MNRRVSLRSIGVVTLLFSVSGSSRGQDKSQFSPAVLGVDGDVDGVHDPSIVKEGDTWYLLGTVTEKNSPGQIPIRCSKDLQHWRRCGFVFQGIPEWIQKESPKTQDLWAPDEFYLNGKYHLYYAFSVFGRNTSGIALATNKTLDPSSPDYKWTDEGLVLRSREEDDFNAIDPNIVIDSDGSVWMSFGSFWGGIKMRRIDPQTGKLSTKDTKLYSLAKRVRPENSPARPPGLPDDWQAIEAPFIVRHNEYYYLFVSFDLCCRGVKSNYKTMVGRSRNVTGPYVDASGKPMLEGGGTPLLVGNERWAGPGGESILQEPGRDIIVFHAYDGKTGKPRLHISTIDWAADWPHAALEGGNPAARQK
jgi:arabinan endo-1,5-alpha-L-arabinosidase